MTGSRKRGSGWWSVSLLSLAAGAFAGCGGEHPDTGEPAATAVQQAAVRPQAPAPLAPLPPASGPPLSRRPPVLRTMADGHVMLAPQEPAEVTTLQRQPDGTFKRVCGAPTDDQRSALELARRNRGRTP